MKYRSAAQIVFCCFILLSRLILAEGAEESKSLLMKAAAELEKQNQAWDDLAVEYRCESWVPDSQGQRKLDETLLLRWSVTQSGWERIRRVRPENPWIEEACFNGEYSMTYDSQQAGSAGVGHQISHFLNITDSPKIFGLFVTGLELGQPVSIAKFLKMESAHVKVLEQTGSLVIVEGDDPMAEGVRLNLTLDANFGYRPIEIEVRDERGLLSTYQEIEYEKLRGKRGDFWFPRKGSWQGVNPEDRSPGTRMDYILTNITIDQSPEQQDFQLTYSKGTLLLNTDTGETRYAAAEVGLGDLINDTGKTISMEEHDRLAARNLQGTPDQLDGKSNRMTLVFVSLGIILTFILAVFLMRSRRYKSI